MFKDAKNIHTFVESMRKNPSEFEFIDNSNKDETIQNLDRCYSI